MSDNDLRQLSLSGDPLADAVVLRLDPPATSSLLAETIYQAKTEIGVYQEFMDQLHSTPAWVDWDQVEHGRHLLATFNHARSIAIFCGSLLEGYCRARATAALLSKGHLHQVVRRRLQQVHHLIHRLLPPDSLRPGQPGHSALAELRLDNALQRKQLLARGWRETQRTLPLSQTDLAFDMLEQSHIAHQGMERLGIDLAPEDRLALQHLWRYCGWLYGVDERLLNPSPQQEAALYRQLRQGPEGMTKEHELLARTTLSCVAELGLLQLPKEVLSSFSQLCLAPATAAALGIEPSPEWTRAAHFYVTANRGATFLHYRIPGMSGLNERLQRYLSRNLTAAPGSRPLRKSA